MALFKAIKKSRSDIDTTPVSEGQFLISTDTGEMFLDVNGVTRIAVGGGSGGGGSSLTLTEALGQPVGVGGTTAGVTTAIRSGAVTTGGGLLVNGGKLELDAGSIGVSLITDEI